GPQWHVLLREDGVELLFDGGDSSWRRVPMTRGQLGEAFILGQRPVPPPPAEIDPAKPMVALSFDDGPSEVTLRLLRLLNEYNGRATFFTLGTLAETHGDTLRMIVEQGSELGGHSWDHKDLTKLTEDQIRAQLQRTNDAIYEHTGIVPAFYRPPFGAVNAKLRSVSKEMGQAMIHWSVDTLDWKTRDAGRTEQAVFSALRDGSIVLCHDLYGATGDAMARVIPRLSEMGYQMVTVSELMRYRGHALEPGAVYFDGYAAEALS
ncbi:MAG: polysaccharide deacetylase family protein, partial [Oscillospiraceae bacterium]|nr:polysaccharide deacetylase family protein [Oscillospiraceae bacterium]